VPTAPKFGSAGAKTGVADASVDWANPPAAAWPKPPPAMFAAVLKAALSEVMGSSFARATPCG
jgi:hypothetical protein